MTGDGTAARRGVQRWWRVIRCGCGENGRVTSSLRFRSAIVLLLGTLLIPVATSSLRGLTHALSCSSPVEAKFDVTVPPQGKQPVVVLLEPTQVSKPDSSPDHISRTTTTDDGGFVTRPAAGATTTTVPPGPTTTTTTAPPVTITVPASTVPALPKAKIQPVCGGILVDMRLSAPSPGWIRVDLPVTNAGHHQWKGTVQLRVASKEYPVELGSVPPGQTRTKSIEVHVDTTVDRVTGELLLGP
jgi:hypothetical protein